MSNIDRFVLVRFEDRDTGEIFEIQDLKITFQVEKQISTEPNVARIQIYNLADETQAKINFKQSVLALEFGKRVDLIAGYKGQEKVIFTGVIVAAITRKEGPLFITDINVRNIFYELVGKKINIAVSKGELKYKIVLKILDSIGATVERSSILPMRERLKNEQGEDSKYKTNTTLFGTAQTIIQEINNGLIDRLLIHFDDIGVNFNPLGVALDIPAIVYSPTTGLIGTPEPNEVGIDFKVELDPDMRLNAPIIINSVTVRAIIESDVSGEGTGRYVAKKVIHNGSNRADGPFETSTSAIYESLRIKATA